MRHLVLAILYLTFLTSLATAAPIIVTFDDLLDGVVPDGYGGITWNGNWFSIVDPPYPFTPHTPPVAVYTSVIGAGEVRFSFSEPIYFVGAFFALTPSNTARFNLYRDSQLVHTSVMLRPCTDAFPGDPVCDNADPGENPPRFLPSGYYALRIDEVGVFSDAHGLFVMDSLVYGTGPESPVPEPATASLLGVTIVIAFAASSRLRKKVAKIKSGSPARPSY